MHAGGLTRVILSADRPILAQPHIRAPSECLHLILTETK